LHFPHCYRGVTFIDPPKYTNLGLQALITISPSLSLGTPNGPCGWKKGWNTVMSISNVLDYFLILQQSEAHLLYLFSSLKVLMIEVTVKWLQFGRTCSPASLIVIPWTRTWSKVAQISSETACLFPFPLPLSSYPFHRSIEGFDCCVISFDYLCFLLILGDCVLIDLKLSWMQAFLNYNIVGNEKWRDVCKV